MLVRTELINKKLDIALVVYFNSTTSLKEGLNTKNLFVRDLNDSFLDHLHVFSQSICGESLVDLKNHENRKIKYFFWMIADFIVAQHSSKTVSKYYGIYQLDLFVLDEHQLMVTIKTDSLNCQSSLGFEHKQMIDMEFINKTTLELLSLKNENEIYGHIGKKIEERLPGCVIIIIKRKQDTDKMIFQGFYGIDLTLARKLFKHLGYNLKGKIFNMKNEVLDYYLKGCLVVYPGDYVEYAAGEYVNEAFAVLLQNIFNINKIYLMGFVKDDQCFAGVQIYSQKELDVQEQHLLENLIQNASLVLQIKQAQAALEDQKEFLNKIIDNLPLGLQIYDKNGYTSQINKKQLEYLKQVGRKVDFKSFNILTDPYSKTIGAAESYSKVYLNRELIHKEFDFEIGDTTKQRKFYKTTVYPLMNDQEEVISVVSLMEDITGRKLSEQALRSSEEKYRTLINTMHDGLLLIDNDGIVKTANQSAAKILGVELNELIGNSFYGRRWKAIDEYGIAINNDNRPAIKALKTGLDQTDQIMGIIMSDGKIKWLALNAVPLFTSKQDVPDFAVVTFSDITKMKETENALLKSKKELQELNDSLNKFFNIISHDLKNPFIQLVELSKLTLSSIDNNQTDEAKLYSQLIKKCSESSRDLLLNLLDWSRCQSGNIQVDIQPIDIQSLIQETCNLLAANAFSKNINLNIVSKPIHVLADNNMLKTILRNLISNAIKFSYKNSSIDIMVVSEFDTTSIVVKDYGVGIKNEDLEKMFDLDLRITTYGTENEKGTGLGFVLIKEFVSKINGTLMIHSKYNEGSTFTVTLQNA